MEYTRKIFKAIKWAAAGICLLWCLALGVFYWMAQRSPEELTERWLGDFTRATGYKIDFESVVVTLLPLPALSFSEISIEGNGLKIDIPWISARPSFLGLLSGEVFPASINVLRPRIQADLPCSFFDAEGLNRWINKEFGFLNKKEKSDSSHLFELGCDLLVIGARLRAVDNTGLRFGFRGARGALALGNTGRIDGKITVSSVIFGKPRDWHMKLEKLDCDLDIDPASLADGEASVKINGYASVKDYLARSAFNLEYEGSRRIRLASLNFDGALELNKTRLPASLSAKVSWLGGSNDIYIRDLEFLADRDSGGLEAQISLPDGARQFGVKGSVFCRRLSLTQWFGFARNLTPGLQLSMDNIINASMKFEIASNSLRASDIVAECAGSIFKGSGSVADFRKPVVALNLKSASANLGRILPEAVGKTPRPPYFPYPPLTPLPGEPLPEGETGIDYDLRFMADNIDYGDISFQKASLRIYPGKMDVTRIEDVLLDCHAIFYGGSVVGNCILGADPSMPVNIVAKGTNIDGKKLSAKMKSFPFRSGKFEAYVNVFSKGKELGVFLPNLHGIATLKSMNARLDGLDETILSLSARVDIKDAKLSGRKLHFNGKWSGKGATQSFDASANVSGNLAFDDGGLAFKNLPVSVDARLLKAFGAIPAKSDIKLDGRANLQNEKIELLNTQLKIFGLDVKTACKLDMKKASGSGTFSFATSNLSGALKRAGIKTDIPKRYDKTSVQASFIADNDEIKLSNIKFLLGGVSLTGNLDYRTKTAKPYFVFNLNAGDIEIPNSSGKKTVWEFPFMREFDCQGRLRVKSLKMMDYRVDSLDLPLALENGNMSVSPLGAKFYGGEAKGTATLDFRKGLSISANLNMGNINLPALAKDSKMESAVRGIAAIYANVRANLSGTENFIGKLNGKWSISASNGFWQAMKKGEPDGRAISFKKLSASGTINNGVIESSDFKIEDPDLNATGKGWVNILNDKLECNFNIDMRGLPEFPLRLYGTIKDAKTSIGAGRMALNAIAGIGTGFVNMVGGMFSGIGKLFK